MVVKKRMNRRGSKRPSPKFQLAEGETLDYKNFPLLKRFLNERGKLISRRLTGLNAKQQRALTQAVKVARILALLPSGSVKY